MKLTIKLGLPMKIATGIYLICSFFGFPLYMVAPPVLTSVGAKLHAYLFLTAAFGENDPSSLVLVPIVLSMILMLAIVITGIVAILKNRCRLYAILVAFETALTFAFLLVQKVGAYEFHAGIWVNLTYCIWLFYAVFVKRHAQDVATRFRKEE